MSLGIKNASCIFEELSNLCLIVLLISLCPLLLRITAENRAKPNNLFVWAKKPGGTQHRKHTNCTWLFISNCNNASDILVGGGGVNVISALFLIAGIHSTKKSLKLINKQTNSLTQKIHSLYLKSPMKKSTKHLLVCACFSLGSICKYWIYVIDDMGVFTTLSNI